MTESEFVRTNHALARELLTGSPGPVDVAKLLCPYPFPPPGDEYWASAAGEALRWAALERSMSTENMNSSPEAAALVLFSSDWRSRVRTVARRRVAADFDAAEDLLMRECGMVREAARLALAAATRHTWPGFDGVYVTEGATGFHICHDIEREEPDEATFDSMQEGLTLREQLGYLYCGGMAHHFQRVSLGQPLAPVPGVAWCLSFCDICDTNWDVDYEGTRTPMVPCSDPACTRMVHRTCHGVRPYECPQHHHGPTVSGVLCCTGLESHKGAWCLVLSQYPAGERVGVLHPLALSSILEASDAHVAAGRWTRAPGVLHAIGHAMTTGPSTRERFAPCGFGQRAPRPDPLFLTPGLATTIREIDVYEGFSRMCDMFVAAGCDDLDGTVAKWMKQGMPILTVTGSGDAKYMHAQAQVAMASPRVLQRANTPERHVCHWLVARVDAAYPPTEEQRLAYLATLGLTAVQPRARAMRALLPDCPNAPVGSLSTYPVRMMLNPSLHVKAWKDAELEIPAEFLAHEVPPFGAVDHTIAGLFRTACIRSATYGRMYLRMLGKYGYGEDASGMLPRETTTACTWKSDWAPVALLCKYSNSSMVILGCGGAAYWRHILPGRKSYLFEVDSTSLQALAQHHLPDSVHVVPTTCPELEVGPRVVVASMGWPVPRTTSDMHHVTPGEGMTTPPGKWTHVANCPLESVQRAHALYQSM